ncbi:hypothetical protein RHECNPAF_6420054 [Rhizobium etli CNPAF512]|nr:hypothetical protein RHECNPAF_6420054 [Rhizobium etli CNPAF512]
MQMIISLIKSSITRMIVRSGNDQLDVDVATRGLRIRAGPVRLVDKRLGDIRLDAGQADLEPGLQKIIAVRRPEIDFGIHRSFRGKPDLQLAGGDAHRADEAGRPAGGEKLFGIGAGPRAAGRREFDVELSVIALRRPVAPPGGAGLAGIENLVDLGHGYTPCNGRRSRPDHLRRSG